MSPDATAALLLVGDFGGRASTAIPGFTALSAGVSECLSAGWLVSSGGFYLMGAAGELALAGALTALASIPVLANQLIALEGDSRTNSSGGTNMNGFAAWAFAKLGFRADHVPGENYSVGGTSSLDMVGRLSQSTAATGKVICVIDSRNDVSAALTVQQTIDNFTTCLNAWAAAGQTVILCNELPDSGFAGQQITDHIARRNWLADPARKARWPNIFQVSTFEAMLEPGQVCTWKTGYSTDGTHMTPTGHRALGEFLGEALKPLFPTATWPELILPVDASDLYNASTKPFGCLNVNPTLTGTGGTKSGTTTYTGVVPTSWDITSSHTGLTVDCSKGFDSDGFDQMIFHLTAPSGIAGAGTKTVTIRQITGAVANVNALDKLNVMGRFIVDANPVGFRGLGVNAFLTGNNGGVVNVSNLSFNSSASTAAYDGPAVDYKLGSHRITAPSDWATMSSRGIRTQAVLGLVDNGQVIDFTVRISRFGMRKVV